MWAGLELIEANLGLAIEHIILFTVIVGGMIIYAIDFKTGITIQFFMTAGLFVWFYTAGLEYAPALITFFITFIIMCFTLYSIANEGQRQGVI